MSDESRKSFRATQADVINAQSSFHKLIAKLIKENRALYEEEREGYRDKISHAYLGEGSNLKLKKPINIKSPELPGMVAIENAGDMLRFMAFHDAEISKDDDGKEYTMAELWRIVREFALKIESRAVRKATTISPEQRIGGGIQPHKV